MCPSCRCVVPTRLGAFWAHLRTCDATHLIAYMQLGIQRSQATGLQPASALLAPTRNELLRAADARRAPTIAFDRDWPAPCDDGDELFAVGLDDTSGIGVGDEQSHEERSAATTTATTAATTVASTTSSTRHQQQQQQQQQQHQQQQHDDDGMIDMRSLRPVDVARARAAQRVTIVGDVIAALFETDDDSAGAVPSPFASLQRLHDRVGAFAFDDASSTSASTSSTTSSALYSNDHSTVRSEANEIQTICLVFNSFCFSGARHIFETTTAPQIAADAYAAALDEIQSAATTVDVEHCRKRLTSEWRVAFGAGVAASPSAKRARVADVH